jgi:hypothetical protein
MERFLHARLIQILPQSKTRDLGLAILGELAEFLPYRSQRITVPYGYDYRQEWIEKAMADTTRLCSKSSFGPSVKEAFLSDARSRKGLTSSRSWLSVGAVVVNSPPRPPEVKSRSNPSSEVKMANTSLADDLSV